VNAPDTPRIRRTVLTSRFVPALALGLGVLSGCAGSTARPPVPLSSLPPGTTTLRITNHVSAPGQLDRITIAVDGDRVPLSSVPPVGAHPATVASLRLPPGAHTITVRARAHAAGEDVIVVGAHQIFHVARGPAAITIDVRSALPGQRGGHPHPPAEAPLALSLAMAGGVMAPEIGVPPREDRDERCAGLLPIPHALCRAAVDLDEANRKNDVVSAYCVRDKIAEMRKLAVIGESGKAESIAMAEAQIGSLARQVELCAGVPPVTIAPDGVTVTRVGAK